MLVDVANLAQNPEAASFEVPPRISISPWGATTSENETICGDFTFENVAAIASRFIGKQFHYSFHIFHVFVHVHFSHFLPISCLFFTGFRSLSMISLLGVKNRVPSFTKHR